MDFCRKCGKKLSECCCDEIAYTAVYVENFNSDIIKVKSKEATDCAACNKYCCTECSHYNFN